MKSTIKRDYVLRVVWQKKDQIQIVLDQLVCFLLADENIYFAPPLGLRLFRCSDNDEQLPLRLLFATRLRYRALQYPIKLSYNIFCRLPEENIG